MNLHKNQFDAFHLPISSKLLFIYTWALIEIQFPFNRDILVKKYAKFLRFYTKTYAARKVKIATIQMVTMQTNVVCYSITGKMVEHPKIFQCHRARRLVKQLVLKAPAFVLKKKKVAVANISTLTIQIFLTLWNRYQRFLPIHKSKHRMRATQRIPSHTIVEII